MTTLIAYASKTGTTEKCAHMLAEHIPDSKVVDIKREKVRVSDYDAVIVGGSIRMGQLDKDVADFITKNESAISAKPYGLFICCAILDQAEETLEHCFSEDLRRNARIVDTFGGELDIEKQKGLFKMMVKAIVKATDEGQPAPRILEDRILDFSKEF